MTDPHIECVVLDDYQQVAHKYGPWTRVPNLTVRYLEQHYKNPDELAGAIHDAEVLVVMRERTPVTADLLERLPRLRLLVTTGTRNRSINLDAARHRGVTVCGTPSQAHPPAELTWALILGLARNLVAEANGLRTGDPRWQRTVGLDLAGSTLGLVGLGKIGTRVAAVANAFEMDVQAWSPHLTDERAAAAGARRAATLEDLMGTSDWVSIHLVLSNTTRGLIGARQLRAMNPGAYLVNTSRAGLVDTDALIEVLGNGLIAGAGLDVYDLEPLPADHPLRTLPTVLGLPHLGYVTSSNYSAYFEGAVECVERWLAGDPVRTLT